jgi:hypothetical protein
LVVQQPVRAEPPAVGKGPDQAVRIDVADSRPLVAIILPDKPNPTERHAAEEGQRCLALMTNVSLPVLRESQPRPPAGRVLHVGQTEVGKQSLPATGWEPESILLDSRTPENILIIGGSDIAVLFAAYRFLHDLGCRWLKPGKDEEFMPHREWIAVPRRQLISSPDFAMRGWLGWGAYSLIDMGNKGPFRTDQNELADWAVRNGLNWMTVGASGLADLGGQRGHGYPQRQGHTLIALLPSGDHPGAQQLFQAHPEYYPLRNGLRVAKYQDGRPVQACLSNPAVASLATQHVLAFLQQHPQTHRFSVAHNDEPSYWCECAPCRALDAPGSAWKANSLYDAYPDRAPAGPGPMSDRYVDFVN